MVASVIIESTSSTELRQLHADEMIEFLVFIRSINLLRADDVICDIALLPHKSMFSHDIKSHSEYCETSEDKFTAFVILDRRMNKYFKSLCNVVKQWNDLNIQLRTEEIRHFFYINLERVNNGNKIVNYWLQNDLFLKSESSSAGNTIKNYNLGSDTLQFDMNLV